MKLKSKTIQPERMNQNYAPATKLLKSNSAKVSDVPKWKKANHKKPNVIVNKNGTKNTKKQFQISYIPYPFRCREDHQTAMSQIVSKIYHQQPP
jgi:U3 small nucleolar RNA-associated protein 14